MARTPSARSTASIRALSPRTTRFGEIVLKTDDIGVNYDFGELLPAKIHGNVHYSDNWEDCMDENAIHEPIEGAKVELFDDQGNLLETTFTDVPTATTGS